MTDWKRKRRRRTKPYKTVRFRVFPDTKAPTKIIECPRCHRDVGDNWLGRRAHATSCVRIPAERPESWGRKQT